MIFIKNTDSSIIFIFIFIGYSRENTTYKNIMHFFLKEAGFTEIFSRHRFAMDSQFMYFW